MSMDVNNENDSLYAEHEIYASDEPEEERESKLDVESEQPVEASGTFAFELLICSLILWSFLFLKSNHQYQGVITEIDEILSTKSHLAVAVNIEEKVTEVFHELLW